MKKTILLFLILTITNAFSYTTGLPKDMQLFNINLTGGINNIEPKYCPVEDASDLENFVFNRYGLLETYYGWRMFDLIDTPYQINNTFNFNDFIFVSIDTMIFKTSGVNDTLIYNVPLTKGSNYRRSFVSFNNQLYMGDGQNRGLKYNISEDSIYVIGITAPTSFLTLTNGGAGQLDTGTYKYLYRYESTTSFNDIFSNPQSLETTITLTTNSNVVVSNIDTSPNALVDAITIWRTELGGAVYYKVGSIDNDTTYFYDNNNDTALAFSGGALELNGHSIMPYGEYLITHKNRMWTAGYAFNKKYLYFSGYGTPEEYNENTDFINFANLGLGEDITGISVVNDLLVVFTQNTTFTIKIDDSTVSTNWVIRNISNSIGCINHFSIANLQTAKDVASAIIFVGNSGIYSLGVSFSGENTNNGFTYIGEQVDNVFKDYIKPNKLKLYGYYDFKHQYHLAYSENGFYNDKELIYNTRFGTWTKSGGLYINSYTKDNSNNMIMGSSLDIGLIMQQSNFQQYFSGYTYDNSISSHSDTKFILTEELTDTLLTNQLIGASAWIASTSDSGYQHRPIIANDSKSITLASKFDLTDTNLTGFSLQLGGQVASRLSGWIYGNEQLSEKVLRYAWFEISGNQNDFDMYIYMNSDENIYYIPINKNTDNNQWDNSLKWDAKGLKWDDGIGDSRMRVTMPSGLIGEKWRYKIFSKNKLTTNLYSVLWWYQPQRFILED